MIAAVVILSGLAAALSLLSSETAMTSLVGANEQRAYYLALSGLNLWQPGRNGNFSVGGDGIALQAAGPDATGYYTVTSLGRVNVGSGQEANVRLTARRLPGAPIIGDNDDGSFTPPVHHP